MLRTSLRILAIIGLTVSTGCVAYVDPAPRRVVYYTDDYYYGPYYGPSVVYVGGYYHSGYYRSGYYGGNRHWR